LVAIVTALEYLALGDLRQTEEILLGALEDGQPGELWPGQREVEFERRRVLAEPFGEFERRRNLAEAQRILTRLREASRRAA
jgi:hypothetical protein